jgi:quinol monooxygenase YgiN
MFIFAATISAHPDRADRLAQVLGELAAASRADAGCQEFSFNRDVEDPLVFRSFEVWDSVEQEANHRETDHERRALSLAASEGLAVGAEMKIYQAELLPTAAG